jgi:hypothetical protein
MYVKQNVSILFILHTAKMGADRKCPIHVRLTINGVRDEISTGVRVAENGWVADLKQVAESEPNYKLHNKRLHQIQTGPSPTTAAI